MKKYLLFIGCLLWLCLITGCYFDDKLSSKEAIINSVKMSLPNADFIRMEEVNKHSIKDRGETFNVYYFNNGGIEFTVEDYLYKGEYSFTYEENISDTYMEKVYDKKSVELTNLVNKYSGIEEVFDYGAFYFTPLNYQDFDNLDKFLNEYLNLLKEYLPYSEGPINSDFSISLSIPNIELYGPEKMFIHKYLYIDTFEEVKNNSVKELQEMYLKNVKLGYIKDNTISYENTSG